MALHPLLRLALPHLFGMADGGSAIEEIVFGILILGSGIAYIVWLVKRKL